MAFRTSLRLCHHGWEPCLFVIVEPWAIEYPVAAGEACEVVAVHPEVVPTFTVGPADGKLVVRVNEGGSTFEFWRAGRLHEQMPVPAPAGGCGPHGPGVPAVRSTPLAPLAAYSVYAPVHLVEDAPGHMVLRSRPATHKYMWVTRVILLVLALVCLIPVGLLGFIVANRPGLLPFFVGGIIGWCTVVAVCVVGFIRMRRFHSEVRQSGTHFDRNASLLRFGPPTEPETRALSTIVAIQLVPTTVRAVSSLVSDPSTGLIGRAANWVFSKIKTYQLNLVFADGSRLILTSWENRRAMEELARQLAEFLKVPVIGPAAG